jgi:pyruvate/2-oxoglutarate dehydrogenase complex dihydrolipoamide acyltransferase (E2) component
MPTEFRMPKLGESVVEGTISRWLKQPGERVARYEPLLEVQTDKVDTEVPAPVAGIVRELAVPEGATVKVGTLIAVLDDGEEQLAASPAAGSATTALPAEIASSGEAPANGSRFVSPVVARMAAEHGLDLNIIKGTGIGGRVSKKDVERFLAKRPTPQAVVQGNTTDVQGNTGVVQGSTTDVQGNTGAVQGRTALVEGRPAVVQGSTTDVQGNTGAVQGNNADVRESATDVRATTDVVRPLPTSEAELLPISPIRRVIAEHMEHSVRTAPHVTTVFEVDIGRVVEHRERNRAELERQGARLTLTPYFVQAVIAGLQATPIVNSTWTAEGIVQHRRAHIGIAVALDEGLIVPVLRDADEKSLLGLARAVNDLSERARARRLQPGETQGGTFTLTNHGVSGSLLATPIINQPQSAILGVGAVQKRPVVVSHGGVDSLAIRPMCYLSLSFDHRLIDGVIADSFLAAVKRFLENYAA